MNSEPQLAMRYPQDPPCLSPTLSPTSLPRTHEASAAVTFFLLWAHPSLLFLLPVPCPCSWRPLPPLHLTPPPVPTPPAPPPGLPAGRHQPLLLSSWSLMCLKLPWLDRLIYFYVGLASPPPPPAPIPELSNVTAEVFSCRCHTCPPCLAQILCLEEAQGHLLSE